MQQWLQDGHQQLESGAGFVKDEKLHQLLDEYDKKHKALEEDISRLLENMENKKRIRILQQLHFQTYNGCEADDSR